MKYLYLALAIGCEVFGSSLLKISDGYTKWLPATGSIVVYCLSFYLLSLALREIPLGTCYAIWAGLGIVLTSIVSVAFFGQKFDVPAILGTILIIAGVVVMNFYSQTSH
ncbi:DMT family transporter [Fulvitalea axinellae]